MVYGGFLGVFFLLIYSRNEHPTKIYDIPKIEEFLLN